MLLAGYLALFLWLSLRPLEAIWVAPANLDPLDTIRADLARGPQAAVYGIGSAMLTLAPLGLLMPLVVGHYRRRALCAVRTVFTGVMLSFVTEFLQSGVPGHVADVDTVLLSGLGVALTHLVCYGPMRRWVRRRWLTRVALAAPREVAGSSDSGDPPRPGGAARSGQRPTAPWVTERVALRPGLPDTVGAGQRRHRVGIAP